MACRKCACGVCAALCSPRPKRTGRAHCSPGASPFSLSQRLRYRSLVSSLGASSPVFARSCIQRKGARSSSACLSLLLLVTSTPSPPPRCTPWLLHHPTQREACRRISSCSVSPPYFVGTGMSRPALLRHRHVKPQYASRLENSYREVKQWMQEDLGGQFVTIDHFDNGLEQFVQSIYNNTSSTNSSKDYSRAVHAVLSVQSRHKHLRGQL